MHVDYLGGRVTGGDEVAEPGPGVCGLQERIAVLVGPGSGVRAGHDGAGAELGEAVNLGSAATASPNWTAVCQASTSYAGAPMSLARSAAATA